MTHSQNNQAQHFRSLHRPGNPLILANVYDAATAAIVATNPGAQAIATASFAIAGTHGVEDNSMSKEINLTAVATIIRHVQTVDPTKPITVDIQDGYGSTPAELASTIKDLIALGAVGCNLEDNNNATGTLRPLDEAVERVHVAVTAAREAGVPDFVVNARTDVLADAGATIDDAIDRGKAFLDAGACTVFIWGPKNRGVSRDEVKRLTVALKGMVNVKLNFGPGFLTVPELRELGVARISVGPGLYKAAMKTFTDLSAQLFAA
ncbi:Pyruvate/Phosphoenolpyruvate kinase [Penicillium lagena]|uniref:Pyruvate/Phosphoenolpyruvate kinase n=1 Tax=Penicillium lagena TaxID=94218 RepID=UPI0025408F7E|nr:Pyruvate/Phosphoenolpyruvate kinase [Penicillium lagena]KAJ5619681.1 Pyruvate/Phosphoenolpyruvate kinase [Penicillium lagena]